MFARQWSERFVAPEEKVEMRGHVILCGVRGDHDPQKLQQLKDGSDGALLREAFDLDQLSEFHLRLRF